jgi:hypothetical protein
METDGILPKPQEIQISSLLAWCLARGAGRIAVVVENHSIRRIRRAARIYNPNLKISQEVEPRPLKEILGVWFVPFLNALAEVMGLGWGTISIGVENGQIDYLESNPSFDAD